MDMILTLFIQVDIGLTFQDVAVETAALHDISP
jgi:hypothetical protein